MTSKHSKPPLGKAQAVSPVGQLFLILSLVFGVATAAPARGLKTSW